MLLEESYGMDPIGGAGIAFLYMAGRCRIGVGDFALNTPIDRHGGIRGETF